jgi:hypothetical protein
MTDDQEGDQGEHVDLPGGQPPVVAGVGLEVEQLAQLMRGPRIGRPGGGSVMNLIASQVKAGATKD